MDVVARATFAPEEGAASRLWGWGLFVGLLLGLLGRGAARGESWIEIVSMPPGAKIEVNGTYIGRAPVWYAWSASTSRSDSRRDRGLTIAAFPSGPGQRTVARGFPRPKRGSGLELTLPERVVLDLRMATVPAPVSPAEAPEPADLRADSEPEVEAGTSEPNVEPFLWPWAHEAHRSVRELLVRGAERWVLRLASAGEPVRVACQWLYGLAPAEPSAMPRLAGEEHAGAVSPPPRHDTVADLLLTGFPGVILLGSAALLVLVVVIAVGRFFLRIATEWAPWESWAERRQPAAAEADIRHRYALYCAALGLPPEATFEEIKRRYRELAIRCHPDKSQSHSGAEQFKRISHAYAALERLWLADAARPSYCRRGTG